MVVHASLASRLTALASEQFGVLSVEQALDGGLSHDQLRCAIRRGLIGRVLPGVYAIGHVAVAPSDDARAMAGVLFGGAGAALSLESAASRWGMWKRPSPRISVVCRRNRNMRPPRWLHLWRSITLVPSQVARADHMPCTSTTRTICDLGRVLTPWQLANVMYEAAFLGMLDLERVQNLLQRRQRQPGTTTVRRAIEMHLAGSAGTRSRSEDRLIERLAIESVPLPLVNQRGSVNVRGIECDFVWPRYRLVIDIDGSRVHGRPGVAEWDADRDRVLTEAGWRIIRIPADRIWNDLGKVIAEIRAAIRANAVTLV